MCAREDCREQAEQNASKISDEATLAQVLRYYEEGIKHLFQFYARSKGKPGKSANFGDISAHCSMMNAAEFLRMSRDFGLAKLPGMSKTALKKVYRNHADRSSGLKGLYVHQLGPCLAECADVALLQSKHSSKFKSQAERANALMYKMDLSDDRRRYLNNRMRGFGAFQAGDGILAGHQEAVLGGGKLYTSHSPLAEKDGTMLDFGKPAPPPRTQPRRKRRRPTVKSVSMMAEATTGAPMLLLRTMQATWRRPWAGARRSSSPLR